MAVTTPNGGRGARHGTYWERPFHICLVSAVLLCLLLLAGVFAFLGWNYRGSNYHRAHFNESHRGHLLTPPGDQVTDYDLQTIGQALWDLDRNRLKDSEYILNLQAPTEVANNEDLAPDRLFSMVAHEVSAISDTHRTCLDLFNVSLSEVRMREAMTLNKRRAIDAFLAAVMQTEVMQEAQRFLVLKGYCESTTTSFKQLLYQIWFEPHHSAAPLNASDVSGFDHVFVGITSRDHVIGLNNWLQVYQLERSGKLDYMGYLKTGNPRLISIQFKWRNRVKNSSTFFLGTTPEFDLAVYTVCFIVRTNQMCALLIDYFSVHVQTWDVSHVTGMQIGAAYPIL